jgi:uncharacterized protein (TIGR02145 family)
MNKKFYKGLALIASLAVMFSACSKDDDSPVNPTTGKTTAVFNPNVTYGSVTDQDGNTYKTVTIGNQTWMAENLRTTRYNDSSTIPNVTDNAAWAALTTGAYCTYHNTTDVDTIATYGRLYNWYAINTSKLAPKGWHVATFGEWEALLNYLGGWDVAGGKLKEAGTTHWNSPNTGATNESGFTALPGGNRYYDGRFYKIGYYGDWWSSTDDDSVYARNIGLDNDFTYFYDYVYNFKADGFSVRCVKDSK